MDKLIVKGVGVLDGEYSFDIVAMLSLGVPGALTSREGHRIKTMCGLRVGELQDALQAGDSDVLVALTALILARHGKRFDDDVLWDAPIGFAMLEIADRAEEEDEDDDGDADPQPGPVEPPPSDAPSTSGGGSSNQTSDPPVSDPSPTGHPASLRSVTSDPETLAS